jgi:hypothetical protein
MSTTSGSFDETILLNQRVRADEIMFDDRIKQQYIPHIEVINAINKAQTATIGNFFNIKDAPDGKKTITVEVQFMNACGIELNDCVPCSIGGNKLSTNKKEYALDICKEVNFTVSECDFVNNDFGKQEAISKGMLAAEKLLAEFIARTFVARIYAEAGINTFAGLPGIVIGNLTTIPAAYWTAELIAYFNQVAIDNNFGNPILISGANLYRQELLARYNAGNSNGVGQNNMFGAMNINFDLKNIDSVIGTPTTFMINTGAIAWVTKSLYSTTIETMSDGKKRWMEMSKVMPGMELSLEYQNECDDCGLYKHNYKLAVNAGLFINPVGCDLNNNGLISFQCV